MEKLHQEDNVMEYFLINRSNPAVLSQKEENIQVTIISLLTCLI